MDLNEITKRTPILFCTLLVLVSISIGSSVGQNASYRICVIAVHDSSLFTLCAPPLWEALSRGESMTGKRPSFGKYYMVVQPEGNLSLVPLGGNDPVNPAYSISILPPPFWDPVESTLDRAHPNWLDMSRMASGIGASGWMDPQIKNEIEVVLAKQKEYVLVDSPERADLVFLAEGQYYVYWPSAESARISNSMDSSRAAFGKQVRSVIIGVVVASEIYKQHPTDAENLIAERIWAGVALNRLPPT